MFRAIGFFAFAAATVGAITVATAGDMSPPPYEWRGTAYVTSTTTSCPSSAPTAKQMLRFRFSQANLVSGTTKNDTKSRLSFFTDYFGISFVKSDPYVNAKTYSVSGGFTGAGTSTYPTTSDNIQPTANLTLVAPTSFASLTTSTAAIQMTGTIANFWDTSGCTMTFTASALKRP